MSFAKQQAEQARMLAQDADNWDVFSEVPLRQWEARKREVQAGLLACRKVQEQNGVDLEQVDDLISRCDLLELDQMDLESIAEFFGEVADFYDGE